MSNTLRIGYKNWLEDEHFAGLMALLLKYRKFTDELTFFTSETHPPLPLDEIRRRCEILSRRMKEARMAGFRAGINLLSTVGHHDENLENSLSQDYPHLTDITGAISRGTICPNHDVSREYIKNIYIATAKAGPDYIWIDDDVRLSGHKPVTLTCFCDRCLEIFADEYGKLYTRDELAALLNDADGSAAFEMRKKWLQHNRNTIVKLFELIESTVRGIDPEIILGFMTGDRFYEGYDFEKLAEVLSGKDGKEVMWRPGGGFYDENVPADAFNKSHDIGRQISPLPPYVKVIQSEIENFPYQLLRKTPVTTAAEACAHIAAGCTGTAFNLLSESDVAFHENELMISYLEKSYAFRELLAETGGRSAPEGVRISFNKDSQAAVGLGTTWFRGGVDVGFGYHLLQLGFPAAYRPDKSNVTLLSGNGVYALSDDELKDILSKGVYIDSYALNALNIRGFSELTGFETGEYLNVDCSELMLDHPLNNGMKNTRRDARQSFWAYSAASLKPLSDEAQKVCSTIDYGYNTKAECCMGIFENKSGGRICVSGYYPWTFLYSFTKSTQMKRVFRWLSRDTLPAYVSSYNRISLWSKRDKQGEPVIIFANPSMMDADQLEIAILTDRDTVEYYDMDCNRTELSVSGREGPYAKFKIPELRPMRLGLIKMTGNKEVKHG